MFADVIAAPAPPAACAASVAASAAAAARRRAACDHADVYFARCRDKAAAPPRLPDDARRRFRRCRPPHRCLHARVSPPPMRCLYAICPARRLPPSSQTCCAVVLAAMCASKRRCRCPQPPVSRRRKDAARAMIFHAVYDPYSIYDISCASRYDARRDLSLQAPPSPIKSIILMRL